MTISNPVQIKEFINLSSEIDVQCNLCYKTANHLVITRQQLELMVCEDCFGKMLVIECMFRYEN